jgi:hypothetical protein
MEHNRWEVHAREGNIEEQREYDKLNLSRITVEYYSSKSTELKITLLT